VNITTNEQLIAMIGPTSPTSNFLTYIGRQRAALLLLLLHHPVGCMSLHHLPHKSKSMTIDIIHMVTTTLHIVVALLHDVTIRPLRKIPTSHKIATTFLATRPNEAHVQECKFKNGRKKQNEDGINTREPEI
jgi:hypothetical protein